MKRTLLALTLAASLAAPSLALAQSALPCVVRVTRDLGQGNYVLAGTKCSVVASDKAAGTIVVLVPVVTPFGVALWEVTYLPEQVSGS